MPCVLAVVFLTTGRRWNGGACAEMACDRAICISGEHARSRITVVLPKCSRRRSPIAAIPLTNNQFSLLWFFSFLVVLNSFCCQSDRSSVISKTTKKNKIILQYVCMREQEREREKEIDEDNENKKNISAHNCVLDRFLLAAWLWPAVCRCQRARSLPVPDMSKRPGSVANHKRSQTFKWIFRPIYHLSCHGYVNYLSIYASQCVWVCVCVVCAGLRA